MSRALAAAAVTAWTLGVGAMPVAAWLWLRDGRRSLGLVAFTAALIAQGSWLATALAGGIGAVLDPLAAGFPAGWTAWVAGAGGAAALASGVWPRSVRDRLRSSDRAAELAAGLFGLGIFLRQLALLG